MFCTDSWPASHLKFVRLTNFSLINSVIFLKFVTLHSFTILFREMLN